MSEASTKCSPIPLPVSLEGWVQKSGLKRTLNDEVQAVHEKLISDPALSTRYLEMLNPTADEESAEGWIAFEDIAASTMLREYAARNGNHPRVEKSNLATITSCLNTVLRRYGMSRKQRRYTVGGAIVPPPTAAVA